MSTRMIEITKCTDCTYSTAQRTPTQDSFEMAFDYFCIHKFIGKKEIKGYTEAFDDIGPIPDWCPLKTFTTDDFKKGDKVTYIPTHAIGKVDHPDCENGIVSSTNDSFVFVKFDNAMYIMITGDEPYTAHAVRPQDLTKGHLAPRKKIQ